MRPVRPIVFAALSVGLIALAGCADPNSGADAGGGGNAAPDDQDTSTGDPDGTASFPPLDPSTSAPAPDAPPVPADITISVDDGAGTVTDYTLTCQPQGGNHPAAADACSALAAGSAALGPSDPNQACTEIFGGPQTATITGTVNGADVSATFSRANGCEIARWDALATVFQNAGGA